MALRHLLGILFFLALMGAGGCGSFCGRWCQNHPGECCPQPACQPVVGYQPANMGYVPAPVPVAQPRTCTCTCNQ